MNKSKLYLTLLVSFTLQIQFVYAQSDQKDTTHIPAPSDTSIAELSAKAAFYYNMEDYERAKLEYLKMKYFHPSNAELVSICEYSIADLTLKDGRKNRDSQKVQESKQMMERYVQDHPDQLQISYARLALANLYLEEGNSKKSLQSLNDILSSKFVDEPKGMVDSSGIAFIDEKEKLFIQARLSRAYIFLNTDGDIRSSIEDYNAILKHYPDHPDALLGKAQSLARNGETTAAVLILNRLIAQKIQLSDFARQYRNELMSTGE